MPADQLIAIFFFVGWIVLAAGLGVGYKVLRNRERDTRLPQEAGRAPSLEVLGAGRVNRRQWSRGRGCRVSVYDDFLVVSVSSQRLAIPFYRIREVDTAGADDRLTLLALAEDESAISIEFRGPDAQALGACLREQPRGGAKAAGRA